MSSRLSKRDLLTRILTGIASAGWQSLLIDAVHPFLLRVFRAGQAGTITVRVYIWNCTQGGNNRPPDEYRVQLTGVTPTEQPGETTLMLGWHEDYGVFVGFDIRKHRDQKGASPSIQVKESALQAASTRAFSVYDRTNGEIAVCFRPEFFVDYAANLGPLHDFAVAEPAALAPLNGLDQATGEGIAANIGAGPRRELLVNLRRRWREHDFRRRVLSAYGSACAFCGIQLRLVDAAHILPVAVMGSSDETSNGIALCALHHRAFDQNLIAINEHYQIEVSLAACREFRSGDLDGGLTQFRRSLRRIIRLPADRRDFPDPDCIRDARKVRGWRA